MAKIDYTKDIEIQRLLKENSSLKNKLQTSSEKELNLKEKIQHLENSFNKSDSKEIEKLELAEILLTVNIRDEYQYEEIENLAFDILKHGQLQPVLITKDNYLLAGYRRYNALKLLNENPELFNLPVENSKVINQIVCYKLELSFAELTDDQIEELQFAENEQRKSIDHFQVSKLFNRYIEKGYEQKYLCEKFGKKKSYVSSVISIKNLDLQLVKWIKEFQVYAWSKEKYTQLTTVNSKNNEDNFSNFYDKNKGIIGWNVLYKISKHENSDEQKKAFLKIFKNRLSEEELNSNYFKNVYQALQKEESKFSDIIKSCKSFSKSISEVKDKLSEEDLKNTEKYLEKIEKIFLKYSEK